MNSDKTVYFDMDGTIANLYEVDNWLNKLRNEDETPYLEAKPMINPLKFQILINKIKAKGYKVGVISWTSKGGKSKYNSKVIKAKREWLAIHFPKVTFDEVHIIKYGVNKSHVCANPAGILFDDNESIRNDWRGLAFEPDMIEKVLASL